MRYLAKLLRFLLLPYHRAMGLRRDEEGQVIVLTGVMVFIAMIMAISAMNSGLLLFNRVRAQNAVDAAADSFAAYQARGLNFSQHLNDVHYWANWIIFGLESVVWAARIASPLCGIRPPPVFFDYSSYRQCCETAMDVGQALDDAQDTISDLILEVQGVIDVVFPILGALSANGLAEANGADKVLEWLGQIGSQLGGLIGVDLSFLQNLTSSLASVPGLGDIYVICLKPGQLISLNTEEKDPDPDNLPWDTLGIVEGLVIVSDIACALAVSIAMSDEPDHGYGWRDDTYYCGGPSYNTWLAGKTQHNILPGMEHVAWLNPDMGTDTQSVDMYTYEEGYGAFDHRGASSESFRNPAFFAVASSQVGGSPLMERSSHSNFEEYSTADLISVHLGEPGEDGFVKTVFIWH